MSLTDIIVLIIVLSLFVGITIFLIVKYKNNQLDFTPTCSYELLHKQLVVMDNYLDILLERAKVENVEL